MSEETIEPTTPYIEQPKTNITNELLKALCGFHTECPEIPKNNKSFHGPYANIDDINIIINPLLAKNGLFITHEPHDGNYLTTKIFHTSGGFLECTYPMFIKKTNDSQAWGSAITYAKRYATVAMLNLVVGDPDDDGNRQNNYANKPTQKKSINRTPVKKQPVQAMPEPKMSREKWDKMPQNWTDKERSAFHAKLSSEIKYEDLKDALFARGFKKPSSMAKAKRDKLIDLVNKNGLNVIARLEPNAAK